MDQANTPTETPEADAARAAAWAALKETRLTLQRSAAELVDRMIDAKETKPAARAD